MTSPVTRLTSLIYARFQSLLIVYLWFIQEYIRFSLCTLGLYYMIIIYSRYYRPIDNKKNELSVYYYAYYTYIVYIPTIPKLVSRVGSWCVLTQLHWSIDILRGPVFLFSKTG